MMDVYLFEYSENKISGRFFAVDQRGQIVIPTTDLVSLIKKAHFDGCGVTTPSKVLSDKVKKSYIGKIDAVDVDTGEVF